MKETDKNQNYTQDCERVKKAISAYKERLYLSVISNDKSQVKIGDSFLDVGWMKLGQAIRISLFISILRPYDMVGINTELPALDNTDRKIVCKIAAVCLCDTFWKMKLKYHVLWRWYYYFCGYGYMELSDLITVAVNKKNLPTELIPKGDNIDFDRLENRKWLFKPKKYLFGFIVSEQHEECWEFTFAQLCLLSLKQFDISFEKQE